MTYKKIKEREDAPFPTQAIIRKSDGACIPFDDANTDYIEYKEWLAADPNNKPEEAD